MDNSLQPLNLAPGIVTTRSDRGARGRYKDGNNVRFYEGLPRKVGGSQPQVDSDFAGICRKLHPFRIIAGNTYLAVGTNVRFYIWDDGTLNNATPLQDSTSAPFSSTALNGPFDSTAASDIYTVNHTSHGITEVGTYVFFDNATASPTDGITIDGWYTVQSIPDADSFTIQHSVTATNSESGFGGAAVDYDYEIDIGNQISEIGLGYGSGVWRAGGSYSDNRAWSEPEPGGSGFLQPARTWSIDSWGEDLVACPRGSYIYHWDATNGVTTRMTEISNAPDTNEFIFLSDKDRHLISLGAHDGSNSDPLLIRWCSQADFNTWTATSTNTAGDFRVDKGSKLVTGLSTDKENFILTDQAAYVMFFIGFPQIFGITGVGSKCGAVSPSCAIEHGGIVYWMSHNNFYKYDGVVRLMDCEVKNYVFDSINEQQKDLIVSGLNTEFSEIWWWYSSKGVNEVDRYVVYNYEDDIWFFGTWTGSTARTAWVDADNAFTTKPYAAGTDNKLHQHEVGKDDGDTALPASIESYDAEIGEGEQFMVVSKVIPDFKDITGSVNVTLQGRRYPHDALITKGPKAVDLSTTKRNMRLRARQVSIKIDCSEVGDGFWMDEWRAEIVPHGEQ